MMQRPKIPNDVRVAIEAICAIENGAAEWIRQLETLCKSDTRETRNTAVHQLGELQDTAHLPLLFEGLSHHDWTTRLVALHALTAFRHKEVVGEFIRRMPRESGRLSREIADALWNLTGQVFEENARKWQEWWENEGDDFEVVSKDDLAKAEKARELRRLRQRTQTKAEFFGIRIDSHRVIFIIDTSGSMVDPVHGRYVGRRQATRLDVAKEELSRSIKDLAPRSLFNVIAFSFGVGRWMKSGIAASSEHTRREALTFVERLGAGGPTNLYDTLRIAFDDPDVDTIYLLSDGEPTTGKVMDPHRIREDVKFWNRHRNIKIHTIAIGGNLEILEWLALDSNGDHVKIR